ncbi:MAG: 2-amino-4-hydroxy-6-hydroxymethyldihydropteridine diphosphokinase [Thermoplasmata archaeon]|nr:2-amino-4-hydroxy-6-hydroxymethyldihydropteridine diphosphokinase [Thermoplasmata archaeon]
MRALVGIGSNVEPKRNLDSACQRLARDAQILDLSRPWWTPAVGGPPGSPQFLNCVAVVETPLAPVAMRRWLRAVEHDHGRTRGDDRNAPRTLDLDVLAEDAGRGHGWSLRADLREEPYNLLPLADVMPDLRLPDGRTVRDHVRANPLPDAVPSLERPAVLVTRSAGSPGR